MAEVKDVCNAITFLQQQTQVDGNNIGIWGSSFGGGIVIYVAALDERVKCVVANIPVGNGRKWLQNLRSKWEWQAFLQELEEDRVRRVLTGTSKMVNKNHIAIHDPVTKIHNEQTLKENPDTYATELPLETAQAIIEFKPDEVIHKIAPRPILFTVAERDILAPVELAKELYDKAGEPKKYVVIPGINHYEVYSPPYARLVMDEALTWFQQYMPPVSGTDPST